jgi:16S rRNA (guanine(1405)-N(7))-methyltransferase
MARVSRDLVDAVVANKKYRSVSPELVAAVLDRERGGTSRDAELIKATRNKLHQVACAYQDGPPHYDRWLNELQTAHRTGDRESIVAACREIMGHHASTRERLPVLREFYSTAIPDWSSIRTVVDIGCGLNPLTLPLLPLHPETQYCAYDVLGDLVNFLNAAFPILGVDGRAEVCDIVHQPNCVRKPADLALLLKLLPCLEQIEKGAGGQLLGTIDADRILVSFPVRSLGGRSKGMGKSYETWLGDVIQRYGFRSRSFALPSEIGFLLSR